MKKIVELVVGNTATPSTSFVSVEDAKKKGKKGKAGKGEMEGKGGHKGFPKGVEMTPHESGIKPGGGKVASPVTKGYKKP